MAAGLLQAALMLLLLLLVPVGDSKSAARGPSVVSLSPPYRGTAIASNSTYAQACSTAAIRVAPNFDLTTGRGGAQFSVNSHSCASAPRIPLNGTVGSTAEANGSVGGWFPLSHVSGKPTIFVNFSYLGSFAASSRLGTCDFVPRFRGRAFTDNCTLYSGASVQAVALVTDNTTGQSFFSAGEFPVAYASAINGTSCGVPSVGAPSCIVFSKGSWGVTSMRGRDSWPLRINATFTTGDHYYLYFALLFSANTGWIEQDARLTGSGVHAAFSLASTGSGIRLLRIVET